MPVKRRVSKRRIDPRAELEAWESWFDAGVAFDGDVMDLGFPLEIGVDRSERFLNAGQEAWQRLGATFLEAWTPTKTRRLPWAVEQFGVPA